jgi:hypothetical protein
MATQETELISSSIPPADQLSRLFDVDEEATIDSVRKEIDCNRQYPGDHVSVHIRKLLNAVETQNPPSTRDLEKISDYAIDFILQQACTEPENRDILRVPLPEKGNTTEIIAILTVGFFNWLENLIFRNKKQE